MKKYFIAILFVFFIFIISVFLVDILHSNPWKEGFFIISRGENILQIAGNLQRQGYIGSRLIFIFDAVNSGNYKKMKAGKYKIEKGNTNGELIEKFTKFLSLPISVSITPGKTTNDIAQILAHVQLVNKHDFLGLISNNEESKQNDFYPSLLEKYPFLVDKPNEAGLEGYLFPDTYLIDLMAGNEDIIRQILDNFDKKITEDLRGEIKNQKKTIFAVLNMASILEKEVKTYEDKQIVAGILWKRLENNLPLEVDSTLLYYLTSLHPSLIDKDIDSPYNTYIYAGLPKGPICNPSKESIKASVYYKDSDYWFYLSAPSGETIFSKTLGQHLINKAKYLTN